MAFQDTLEKRAEKMFQSVFGWEQKALIRIGKRVKSIGSLSYADLQAINNYAQYRGMSEKDFFKKYAEDLAKIDADAVMDDLAKLTGQNVRETKQIYADTINAQHEENKALYDYRNKPYVPLAENKQLQALVDAYSRTTAETFVNFSMTKAQQIGFMQNKTFIPLQKSFTDVLSKAVVSIATGTGTFGAEMRDVLRELGGSGVRVNYGNGVTRSLDSMVRQNLLWGAKQASREYSRLIREELGCDGIEIDWHSNPRPSHGFMQGKQYVLGKSRTINGIFFESADDALAALDDYGCLHYERNIICGVSVAKYDPEELERLNRENAEPIEIDGVTKSGYEWKQDMRRLERAGRQAKLQREVLKASGDNIGAEQAEKVLKGIRQREKRIMDKYEKIADRTGIKAQREKMSFVKGKDSALPNMRKVVDNSGKSGIIKEQSKKNVSVIADKAIENVPKVQINGFTDEQNIFVQEQHRELLKYAKNNNENKEVAFVFRDGLVDREEFIGSDDAIEFGNGLIGKGDNLFVMHNHPKNSSFSDMDIRFFISNENVKSFSIVKNNGSVEVITKTNEYSLEKIKTVVGRAYKKMVKQGTHQELDAAIEYILSKNGGIVAWIK